MTTQLTARDKKLLVIMSFSVVLFLFFWYVIKPTLASINQLDSDIATAENDKFMIQQELVQLSNLRQNMETLDQQLKELADGIYPKMSSNEIDRMLTGVILSKGLAARSLKIDIPTENAKTAPYYASERAAALEAEESDEAEGGERPGLYAATVSMSLGGERERLQEVLDYWTLDCPSISVASFAWTADKSATVPWILTLELTVYMTDVN